MTSQAIEHLMQEHELISSTGDAIRRLNGTWNNDPEAYANAVRRLLRFFREYSDQVHHHKEEQILFPMLMDHPQFTMHEIVSELEDHHVQFREHTQAIEDALDAGDHAKAQRTLEHYHRELLDHIAAENDELFIMAEQLFSEQELETLYHRFLDFDAEHGEKRVEMEALLTD